MCPEDFTEKQKQALDHFLKTFDTVKKMAKLFDIPVHHADAVWEHGKELLKQRERDRKMFDGIILSDEENQLI